MIAQSCCAARHPNHFTRTPNSHTSRLHGLVSLAGRFRLQVWATSFFGDQILACARMRHANDADRSEPLISPTPPPLHPHS